MENNAKCNCLDARSPRLQSLLWSNISMPPLVTAKILKPNVQSLKTTLPLFVRTKPRGLRYCGIVMHQMLLTANLGWVLCRYPVYRSRHKTDYEIHGLRISIRDLTNDRDFTANNICNLVTLCQSKVCSHTLLILIASLPGCAISIIVRALRTQVIAWKGSREVPGGTCTGFYCLRGPHRFTELQTWARGARTQRKLDLRHSDHVSGVNSRDRSNRA